MSFWDSGIYLVIVAAVGCIVVVAVMSMIRGMRDKKRNTQKKSKIIAVNDSLPENDLEQLDEGESIGQPKQLPGPAKPAIAEKTASDKTSRSTGDETAKAGTTKKPQPTDAFSAAVQEIENGSKEEKPKAPDAFLRAVQEIESGGKEEEDKPKIMDALSAVVQEIKHGEKEEKGDEPEDELISEEELDTVSEPYDEMSIFQSEEEEENPLAELAQNLGDVELDELSKLSRELSENILGRT